MVSESEHIILDLALYIVQIIRSSWVHGTSEHEIMPNQKSELITQIIEDIVFKLTSTPNSDHVIVCIKSILESLIIDQRVLQSSWHKHIRWNIVSALHEDVVAIQINHK